MNDPLLVRRFECIRDLARDRQRFWEKNRALRDAVGESRAFDQFEDKGVRRAAVFEPVDVADVRVVEGGEHLRFASEPRESVGGSTLSATSRLSFVSCARYTSPMPPAPSGARTS